VGPRDLQKARTDVKINRRIIVFDASDISAESRFWEADRLAVELGGRQLQAAR
jgi:hypothetical protein